MNEEQNESTIATALCDVMTPPAAARLDIDVEEERKLQRGMRTIYIKYSFLPSLLRSDLILFALHRRILINSSSNPSES